jgi:hypothetical protein
MINGPPVGIAPQGSGTCSQRLDERPVIPEAVGQVVSAWRPRGGKEVAHAVEVTADDS